MPKITSMRGIDTINDTVKHYGLEHGRVTEHTDDLINSGLSQEQCAMIAELIFGVYYTTQEINGLTIPSVIPTAEAKR